MVMTTSTDKLIYTRPTAFTETPTHYCPGCTHGIAHRLVAEVLEEMGVIEKTIGVAPVGCSVFAYNYFNTDFVEAPHGRAPAMATGIKRVLPDRVVFTYQGDGDLASIGMGEIVAAAARGEQLTVIFINNANFGMTGGQMAPTTLPGQKTSSSPAGREVSTQGYPIKVAELLATLDGASYVVRRSMHDPANIRKAKKAVRIAFETQVQGLGFSLVELLSTCPTNWGMTPVKALDFVAEQMIPVYPLGDYKVSPAVAVLKI
ncbi:MAG: 2-oxoglutarate oxidoreductase [Anaerolineales bacterium]|nr:2-oxoglutarate oxidoreductase [Anaerolineales bacterium]